MKTKNLPPPLTSTISLNKVTSKLMIILFALIVFSACKTELEEVRADQPLEEHIEQDNIKMQLKYEFETLRFSKSEAVGRQANPNAERSRVHLIVAKDNSVLLEIDKLKPQRIEMVRHNVPVDPEYIETSKIKIVDNATYLFDKKGQLIHLQSEGNESLVKEFAEILDRPEQQSSMLRTQLKKLTDEEINKKIIANNFKLLSKTDHVVKVGGTISKSNLHEQRGTDDGLEEIVEYFDPESSLQRGFEVVKNGLVVMRAAYQYNIIEESAELRLMHIIEYVYDDQGTLIDEVVSNTYFTLL